MKITSNDDYKYDIDFTGYNIEIDDSNLFHKKEASSFSSIKKLLSSKVELKSQDNSKNYIWLEYSIIVKEELKLSGILSTESEVYRITIDQIVLEFPTDYLKWLVHNRTNLNIKETKNKANDYIGLGINIELAQILHYQKEYKQSDWYRKKIFQRLKISR